jgi:tetratricopeptide (TPR) repeat protein
LSRWLLALLLLPGLAPWAQAQLIDDVELRAEGGNTVVLVRLGAPVQYLRAVVLPSGELVQAFYEVLPPREDLRLESGQRRIVGGGNLPRVTITDEAVGAGGASRKLVVGFSEAVRCSVRAGRGNRSIEFVLEGLARRARPQAPAPAPAVAASAPVVPPAPAASQAPPPPEHYVIVLKAFTSAGQPMHTPVPRALQDYTVFTSTRVQGVRTVYEVNLGYFKTRAEAERARAMLAPRFPDALIVDLNKPREFEPEPEPVVAAAPAPVLVPVPVPPLAVVPPVPAPVAASAPVSISATASADVLAAELLAAARAADAQQDTAAALQALGKLLDMPPNASSREAQELAGLLRLKSGDAARARAEFELFLKLYPSGPDADRVRRELARLPSPTETRARTRRPPVTPTTTLAGSLSQFYYGGQSKVRTQEFQDSPISGLPELQDNTLSGTDQKQSISSVDLNWRHRDADRDQRFVFRDSYTADLMPNRPNKNRLSALYYDHRSYELGTNVRVGRQSATGGGALGRFDGVQAGYLVAPKWRVNALAGVPTDKLADSKRKFYGTSVDAEALTPELNGSVYVIQQTIDGELDRRALGTELRYFSGGVSAFGTLDYDQVFKGINVAMLQGTWQLPDNTVVNLLYDRRATPMLTLGNTLFFQTTSPPAQSISELLASGATLADLRQRVKDLNSFTTQAVLGATTPLSKSWQLGGDIRFTQIGEIAPVPELLPYGQKKTEVLGLGGQLIGSNLYSARDTHVIGLTWLKGSTQLVFFPNPADLSSYGFRDSTYTAVLLNYNNSSLITEALTLEPSIKLYRQTDNAGLKTTRWSPGLRLTYRLAKQISAESELTSEYSKSASPTRNESSNRVYYYLGARYDF